jgi:hypothetical protein
MAHKRRLSLDGRPEEKKRFTDNFLKSDEDLEWKVWFRTVYARYWYLVLCMGASALGMLAARWDLGWGWEVAVLVPLALLPLEVFIYLRLWGKRKKKEQQ